VRDVFSTPGHLNTSHQALGAPPFRQNLLEDGCQQRRVLMPDAHLCPLSQYTQIAAQDPFTKITPYLRHSSQIGYWIIFRSSYIWAKL